MYARPRILRFLALTIAGATIGGAALTGIALGDTLELKTGQIVQGKFLGGSPMNIRFQVDGKEQVFATKDVLNIGFSDSGEASSAAPHSAGVALAAPAAAATQVAPSSVTQLSAPTTQVVTIPAGSSLLVRMIDSMDSSENKIGDKFHASLESALIVGNTMVAPKGADVYGKLAQAKEAGKISGSAQLTLELTGIRINGNIVPVDSTTYDVAGKGRGTQSAERIGGGAVVGTIIGAIAGGGKGAVIGGAVGAGAGTAVQVMTHGEQVRIPSETLLEFKLEHDVTAPAANPTN
ncbi:MAG: hypothetical protein LAN36_08070 [Acidobacteriia bacterium]|nr:hypothetical protein [Terriglobia bacterium]